MIKLRTAILSTQACILLSACMMVGPDYKEPRKNIAQHWLKNTNHSPKSSRDNANWWQVFRDPTLTRLIDYGYHHNLSLKSAGIRVLQARAQLAQSVGEFYPQQQAMMGNYLYNRIGGSSLEFVLPPTFDTASLGFSAAWELDFWGKYRRAILSNDAQFLSSFAAFDHALVTLTSDIATSYINIRTTQWLISVTQKNITVQKNSLAIAKARFDAGQTSLLDVEQAQSELSRTQAELPKLYSELQHHKDTLALLLGEPPDKLPKLLGAPIPPIPSAPRSVAIGIPKEVLAKRPDIYQARMEAIAQSEAIGAVKANLYPALSLTGTFALASNNIGSASISDLFNWSNRNIIAGPGFNWPLLNYGQITNAVRVQDAAFQQSLINYMNVVLKAQQEVQDALTQYIEIQKSRNYLANANQAAIKSTQLALIRYKEGESDYTTVLDAERQQLRIQSEFTRATGDVPKAVINLYRALGGGWQIRKDDDIVPKDIKAQMSERTNWGNLLQEKNHLPPKTKSEAIKQIYLPNW